MDAVQLFQGDRRHLTFYNYVPSASWYSFDPPQKDESLTQFWSHLVVLNAGTLYLESSALTARSLISSMKMEE